MTTDFIVGLAIGFLIVEAAIAWVRVWYWKDQAKFLNTMWENEKKMNADLFRQLTEKRPKKFLVDSALMSQLSDEERKAIEDADRSDVYLYPTMVEEPLPPGTVLHQEGKMPEWDELIKTVKRTWANGIHANDLTLGEIEEDISCALDRFAKANGLPEINWDEEVSE